MATRTKKKTDKQNGSEPADGNHLPEFGDEPIVDDESESNDAANATDGEQPEPVAITDLKIEIPLAKSAMGYASKHVEVRFDQDQRDTLRRIHDALIERNAKLRSGRRVNSNADVVRWMVDQVAAAQPG